MTDPRARLADTLAAQGADRGEAARILAALTRHWQALGFCNAWPDFITIYRGRAGAPEERRDHG